MEPIELAVEKYLWYCGKVRGMSEATLKQKSNVLERFVKVAGVMNLSEVTNDVFNAWMAHEMERGISGSSINAYNAIVLAMLRYYRELGMEVPLNIMMIGKVKKMRSERKYYTAEEVEKVIEQADRETGLMIRIMFETGMRIAELTKLRRSEFHGRRIRFIAKGKKVREVYVKWETLREIEDFMDSRGVEDYLWGVSGYGLTGEPPTTATVRNRLREAFLRVGFEGFYPHALRHSFATDLQKRGASIAEIKEMIGHSSVATTERYLHGFEGRLEELFDKYR